MLQSVTDVARHRASILRIANSGRIDDSRWALDNGHRDGKSTVIAIIAKATGCSSSSSVGRGSSSSSSCCCCDSCKLIRSAIRAFNNIGRRCSILLMGERLALASFETTDRQFILHRRWIRRDFGSLCRGSTGTQSDFERR